ncbi:MAG: protein kinase [Christensenellales bacterium]|nr:protein kinase [Christensenellales bacterium]
MESRLIGKIVGRRFRVEDVIGRGGMAIVYRAFDLRTHQTVALKVLREEYEDDPEYRERFKREAAVNRKLNHPNVVNSIDSGASGGVSYIALEYVDGETLKDVIAERGKMDQEEAVHCALCILSALSHAHQRGVIHRDVKSQNVMITRNGQVKIGDFGIAGLADTKTLTTDGNVMGSVHYFSPEQAKGMRATNASDLYSVGVILYEMLTGHVPFEGETAVSVAMMHLMETPKPVEEEANVSRAVELIVKKALEKEPRDRYQSADSMIRDLRRALRHPDGEFMHQRSEADKPRRTQMRSAAARTGDIRVRIAMIAVTVVMMVLIALAGVTLYRFVFVYTRMPDLTGVDAATAERMITSANLKVSMDYAYSDVMEGYVSGQSPEARTRVNRGDTVQVIISRGSDMVAVQRVTGLTQDNAVTALNAQGFLPGEIIVAPSAQLEGTVIAQEPPAGEKARVGSPVNLTVSGGRVVVPDLVGRREEEAVSNIRTLGLTRGQIDYENVTDPRQDGVVLWQSLERFGEVLPGSSIEISVGYYDKRRYTASVKVTVQVPREGVSVRVTLVGEDGKESDMYAATHTDPGETTIDVLLRSETSGVKTWRLYLDGGFRSEATAVLQ